MEYSSGAPPVQRLIDEFSRLPGVGPKSAQRLTYHLIRMPAEQAETLASAILSVISAVAAFQIAISFCLLSPSVIIPLRN